MLKENIKFTPIPADYGCFDFAGLHKTMKTNRLSVSEVAKRANVSRSTVRGVVTNPVDANPRLSTCYTVSKAIEELAGEMQKARED